MDDASIQELDEMDEDVDTQLVADGRGSSEETQAMESTVMGAHDNSAAQFDYGEDGGALESQDALYSSQNSIQLETEETDALHLQDALYSSDIDSPQQKCRKRDLTDMAYRRVSTSPDSSLAGQIQDRDNQIIRLE